MALASGVTFDAALLLDDGHTFAAGAAGQVSAAAKILDLGAAEPSAYSGYNISGDMVIDVTSLDIADNDENWTFYLQGSDSATFASGIENLAEKTLGAKELLSTADVDSAAGRYTVPFHNDVNGTSYRYLRLYVAVDGTMTTTGAIVVARVFLAISKA